MDKVLGDVFNSVLGIKDTLELSISEIKNLVSEGQDAYRKDIEFLIFATRRAPLSSANRFQDLWALFEQGEKRNGYFVEFGASDGAAGSNTLLLEKFYGWQGAIAEPARSRHESLRADRGCYITDKFIYKSDGLKMLFNDVDTSPDSAADVGAPANVRRSGKRYEVETLSLSSFLQEAGAPHTIDYMSINVEDDTLDILTDFDFSAYDIKLLSIAGADAGQRDAIQALLARKGYEATFKTFSTAEDWYVKGGAVAVSPSVAA